MGILIAEDEVAASVLNLNPHTTISQNLGWSLQKGNKFAKVACIVLTYIQNLLAKTGVCTTTTNHCLDAIKDFPNLNDLNTNG